MTGSTRGTTRPSAGRPRRDAGRRRQVNEQAMMKRKRRAEREKGRKEGGVEEKLRKDEWGLPTNQETRMENPF